VRLHPFGPTVVLYTRRSVLHMANLDQIPDNFTGVVYDPPVTSRTDGRRYCAVYEYENGECVDRYITRYEATQAR